MLAFCQLAEAPKTTSISAIGHYHLLENLLTCLSTSNADNNYEFMVPLLIKISLTLEEGFGTQHCMHPHHIALADWVAAVRRVRSNFGPSEGKLNQIVVPHCLKPNIIIPIPSTLYPDVRYTQCRYCP